MLKILKSENKEVSESLGEGIGLASFYATLYYSDVEMAASEKEMLSFTEDVLKYIKATRNGLKKLDKKDAFSDKKRLQKLIRDSERLVNIFEEDIAQIKKRLKG